MGIFRALRGASHRSQERERKTAARLNEITKSACRRETGGNCSPYAPCFDSCPVIAAPAEVGAATPRRGETPPKTRREIVEAIRAAGARNSRVELMRIVADHPLDFATAMAAFTEGLETQQPMANEPEHTEA